MKISFKKSIEFDKYIDLSSYDEIVSFSESMIIVRKNVKYGVLNKTGNIILHPFFDYISSYKEGLARVRKGNKWGFIDKKANIIVPIVYDEVGEFINGKAPVKENGVAGVIDKTGEFIIEPIYDDIKMICGNLVVATEYNKYGVVDLNDNIVVKFKYDDIVIEKDKIHAWKQREKFDVCPYVRSVFDKTGKLLGKTPDFCCSKDYPSHNMPELGCLYSDGYRKLAYIFNGTYALKKGDKTIIPGYLNNFHYDNEMIIHDKKLIDLKDLTYKYKLEIIFDKGSGKEVIAKEFDDEQKMSDFIKMFKQEIKNAKINMGKEINNFITDQEKQLSEFKTAKEDETYDILVNYVDSSYEKENNLSLS